MNNKKGFTLAELLVVVAIIGVLVAISIPIFTSQLKRTRAAVDQAHVRSAKAAAAAAYMASGLEEEKTYFYDAGNGCIKESADGITGYGKSTEDLQGVWEDYADNSPRDGKTAHIVKVTIGEQGEIHAEWEGGSSKGKEQEHVNSQTADDAEKPDVPAVQEEVPTRTEDVTVEQVKQALNEEYAVAWEEDPMQRLKWVPNAKKHAIIQDGESYYFVVNNSGLRIEKIRKGNLNNRSYVIPIKFSEGSDLAQTNKQDLHKKPGTDGQIVLVKDDKTSNSYYAVYYNGKWQKALTVDKAVVQFGYTRPDN